ncbi:hypothetical protein LINGRAHAP2_LOCUS415 [Linum grandiflorum]
MKPKIPNAKPSSLLKRPIRNPEVYREAIVLCMEIIILLGFHLLFYTTLLILQQLFSSAALLLLPVSIAAAFTLGNTVGSFPIAVLRKLMRTRERLGDVVTYAIDNMHERARKDHAFDVFDIDHDGNIDDDARSPKIVAMWTSFAAYVGLLAQIVLRYPFSADTFFACGMITIAVVANLVTYFSFFWNAAARTKEIEELEEVKSKFREERGRWEEEKRSLREELVRAKHEARGADQPQKPSSPPVPRPLGRANSGPVSLSSYTMFGNFDWD